MNRREFTTSLLAIGSAYGLARAAPISTESPDDNDDESAGVQLFVQHAKDGDEISLGTILDMNVAVEEADIRARAVQVDEKDGEWTVHADVPHELPVYVDVSSDAWDPAHKRMMQLPDGTHRQFIVRSASLQSSTHFEARVYHKRYDGPDSKLMATLRLKLGLIRSSLR